MNLRFPLAETEWRDRPDRHVYVLDRFRSRSRIRSSARRSRSSRWRTPAVVPATGRDGADAPQRVLLAGLDLTSCGNLQRFALSVDACNRVITIGTTTLVA
jgi:hypothetical protein